MRLLLVFVIVVAKATADVTVFSLSSGACLCVTRNGTEVRNSSCGSVIRTTDTSRCYKYLGSKESCRGERYEFYQVANRPTSYIDGRYLDLASPARCGIPTGRCPLIVSRAEWGGKTPTSTTAIRQGISRIFIHDTASVTCTSQTECVRTLKRLEAYSSTNTRNSSTGFNFLIGQDGTVYEGRGWDIAGDHTARWDSTSIGIAVIGSFNSSVPSEASQNATKQLIDCGINKAKIFESHSVHGHRDGACSSCPGDAFYNLTQTWDSYGGRLRGGC